MQTVSHLRRFLINCTLMAFLFSLSACQSASQSTASISNSESCFLFSDASWDTPSTELESVEGKSISATSFLGGGDKSYAFDDVSFSDLIGTDTYTYRDSQLWKVTFHYQGHLETEKSEALVEKLKETYSFPTIDKSDLNGNGTGVWLEWHLDSVNITYMYVSGSTSNNNVIVLAYELPSSQILTIDSSSRNGDFRIGYWGDSIDTINLYETAEYMGTASGNSGMVYIGTISGYIVALEFCSYQYRIMQALTIGSRFAFTYIQVFTKHMCYACYLYIKGVTFMTETQAAILNAAEFAKMLSYALYLIVYLMRNT